jgi:hypothetical protein
MNTFLSQIPAQTKKVGIKLLGASAVSGLTENALMANFLTLGPVFSKQKKLREKVM